MIFYYDSYLKGKKGGIVMSINGIGGSGYYNYNNTINQLRLNQALGKHNTTSSTNFYDKKYTNLAKSTYADSQSFIKKYNSSMSDLLQSANSLKKTNSTSVLNDKSAVSSDPAVLTANKKYSWDRTNSNFNIDVKQLAAAQTNTSAEVKASDLAAADATFVINGPNGAASIAVSATNDNGVQKTNQELYNDIAKQVNGANSGVNASVIEKDGKISLQLTSAKTGEENGFSVQGSFAASAGLQNITQNAQDAIYSVSQNNGQAKEYTSSSNKISLDNGKIDVSLKKTGTSNVYMGVDTDKVTNAVSDLVEKYNASLKVLNDNADRGTGVMRQLSNMLHGPMSEEKMAKIGISTNKDGTLSLDKDKLAKSLKEDQNLTTDIIGGSFGLAQGLFSDARSGLTMPSNSLINNDMAKAQEQVRNDSFAFTSMFSRRGAFNMMNYNAVGMMFNMLI